MAIKIRLSATGAELDTALQIVRSAFAVTAVSGRYRNRKDVGERLYLEASGPAGDAPEASPLAKAEDAKRRRDLGAELAVLHDADRQLHAQPWYPLQPGDVVLCAFDAVGDGQPYGETYIAAEGGEDRDADGSPMLRLASSCSDPELPAAGPSESSFYEMWFEAEPAALTVIRGGRIVHGNPLR